MRCRWFAHRLLKYDEIHVKLFIVYLKASRIVGKKSVLLQTEKAVIFYWYVGRHI